MSNYSSSQFVKHPNTPWYKVLKMVPAKARVLDVGCSSGNFGKVLMEEKQCLVDGIEIDPNDAKKAEKVLNKVHVLNIESSDISMLRDKSYDIIYFGDVIEHLVDPIKTLEKVKPKLTPGGSVVFSIPNMTHISVRIMLMGGHFQYGKTGLLDNTHLHYYDIDEVKRVFAEAGYSINQLDWVTRDIPADLLKRQLKAIGLTATDAFIKKSKSLEYAAYQFVGKAKPTAIKTNNWKLPPISPPIDEFEKYLGEVRKEYQATIDDTQKRLEENIAQLEAELTNLQNSISWKATAPFRASRQAAHKLKRKKR